MTQETAQLRRDQKEAFGKSQQSQAFRRISDSDEPKAV